MWADASADGPRRKQARRAQGSDENTTNGCEPGATDERSPAHALPLRERQSNAERAGSGPGDAGVGGGAGGAEQGGCVSGKPRRWTGRRGTAYRCSRCRQPKRGHSCAAEGGADDPGGVPGVGMEAGRALSDKELMLAELAFGGEPPKARAAQQPPPPVGRPPPVLTPDEATARGAIASTPPSAPAASLPSFGRPLKPVLTPSGLGFSPSLFTPSHLIELLAHSPLVPPGAGDPRAGCGGDLPAILSGLPSDAIGAR